MTRSTLSEWETAMPDVKTSHVELIRAVQLATRRLASSGNFDVLVREVLGICVDAVGAWGGTIYIHDPSTGLLHFEHVLPAEVLSLLPSRDIPDDYGMAGSAFQARRTLLESFPEKPKSEWNAFESATGVPVRSYIATPLMLEDEPPIGVVQLLNKRDGDFDETDALVMDTVAAVSTMAYHNFKLSEASSRASTLLGMGKVSHDIGNLAASLYANVNYCQFAIDSLAETNRSEPDSQTSKVLTDLAPSISEIVESVDRIVGYSQLISDLSVGRSLRPNRALAPMGETIRRAAANLESEGRANRVQIRYEIDDCAPLYWHDELFVNRIVQNLAGNAVKAVRETLPDDLNEVNSEDHGHALGEVVVRYAFKNAHHLLEISDTGPGMSEATIRRILSGSARSKWDKGSGSGWGTKIVLELAAAHAGEVSITSAANNGTTFRIRFPHVGSPNDTG